MAGRLALWGRSTAAVAVLIALCLLALVVAWFRFGYLGQPEIVFNGFVKGELVFIGSEDGGRVVEVQVAAGQTVKLDQPLFVLDDAIQRAARDEVAASLSEAHARLARTLAPREPPEQVEILKAQERKAQAALDFSERELNRSERATTAVHDKARAQRDIDQANLDEVRHRIAVAGMSATAEDIDAARAEVAALEAKLSAAQITLNRRQVKALFSGTVQEIYVQSGEIVLPGRQVISLLPAENIIVRFYVAEASLPGLAVGDAVSVSCDGCGGLINARIRFISPTAEFTPPIIYSNEERGRLVFMLEAVPEQLQKLRPGQPVTVSQSAPTIGNR
jgi:HlyD family secretion protein